MKVFSRLMAVMVAVTVCVGTAAASLESGYTWTLSGSLDGQADSNQIFVAVTNDSLLGAATIEMHYDTSVVELIPYTDSKDYLTGKTVDFSQGPIVGPSGDLSQSEFIRLVLLNIDQSSGDYTPIPSGSGNVLKILLKVKTGVPGGTKTTITLTDLRAGNVLATKEIEIEGSIWDTPGDPAQFGWKFKGLAVADSSATEVYIVLSNSLWVADMALDLTFDPNVLEIAAPATDVTLKGRATDVNLDVTYTAGSGSARLTFSTTSSTPPFPVIDAGSGSIVGIKFSVVSPMAAGSSTSLSLALSDGTALTTFQLDARAFSGSTADVDGNGSTTIFDVLEFLKLWSGSPPNPFTDVNGDGKSDIFDLLAILAALKS